MSTFSIVDPFLIINNAAAVTFSALLYSPSFQVALVPPQKISSLCSDADDPKRILTLLSTIPHARENCKESVVKVEGSAQATEEEFPDLCVSHDEYQRLSLCC